MLLVSTSKTENIFESPCLLAFDHQQPLLLRAATQSGEFYFFSSSYVITPVSASTSEVPKKTIGMLLNSQEHVALRLMVLHNHSTFTFVILILCMFFTFAEKYIAHVVFINKIRILEA